MNIIMLNQTITELIAERDQLLAECAEMKLKADQYRAEALAWHGRLTRLQDQFRSLLNDSTESTNPYVFPED